MLRRLRTIRYPMISDIKKASINREESIWMNEIDNRIDLLLSNYQAVTANPRSMGYLRFLLKHYSKFQHPWRQCYKDNLHRFGEKTPALCGVLKDTLRQRTNWRGHPSTDVGSPGVGIGEADKGAAPPWGGHKHLSEDSFDTGLMAMPEDVALILEDLSEKCDVYRVLIGLDEPPHSDLVLL